MKKAYREINGKLLFVRELKGTNGNVDWGYVFTPDKATLLRPWWQNRFRKDMERCGDKAHFFYPANNLIKIG